MKLAASMCSGPMRCSPPREALDALDPQDVRADPVDAAPRARRGSGRDPGRAARRRRSRSRSRRAANVAAMTAFSVPITLASSRKIRLPCSPSARSSKRRPTATSAPSCSNAWTCVSSRRRPIDVAARRVRAPRGRSGRAAGPPSRNEARMRSESSSSASVFVDARRLDAHLVRRRSTRPRRRDRRAARPSCRRRGSAARCGARPARRSAGTRRGSAARRSCSRRRGRVR